MKQLNLLMILLFSIVSLNSCQFSNSESKKPNILFLFADDQRANTINSLGNKEIITPNIDRLVEEGVSFPNSYIMGGSSGAVCAPSRAMMMTGRDLYSIEKQGWQANISENYKTLPETLREAGYQTFGTGKQHNGKSVFARGFSDGDEIFFGGMSDHWSVPVYHYDSTGKYDKKTPFIQNPAKDNHLEFINNSDHIVKGKHSSELFADAAIDFLNNHDKEKPFFAYIAFTAPHDPRSTPKKYIQMYDTAEIKLPPNFLPQHPFDFGEFKIRDEVLAGFPRTKEEVKTHLRDYYAMITHLDVQVGRIIQALKETGEYENTIIIYSADNGLALGQHGMMGKQNLYEHSIGVPFIIAGPGIPKNEKREAFLYLFDIFPTLCDAIDIDVPPTVHGKSFLKQINVDERFRDNMVYGYKEFMRAYREGDSKLIEYFVNGERNTQLFDLSSDPYEKTNLFTNNDYKSTYLELKKKMLNQMVELNDTSIIYKELRVN